MLSFTLASLEAGDNEVYSETDIYEILKQLTWQTISKKDINSLTRIFLKSSKHSAEHKEEERIYSRYVIFMREANTLLRELLKDENNTKLAEFVTSKIKETSNLLSDLVNPNKELLKYTSKKLKESLICLVCVWQIMTQTIVK